MDETDAYRKLIIDPLAANIVRKIFEMAVAGVKLREVSAYLQVHNYTIPAIYLKTNHIYQESGDEVESQEVKRQQRLQEAEQHLQEMHRTVDKLNADVREGYEAF